MKRVILSPLKVQLPAGERKVLPAGSIVNGFHIVRLAEPGAGVYMVEFQWGQQSLSCPLHSFLPRTGVLDAASDAFHTSAAVA